MLKPHDKNSRLDSNYDSVEPFKVRGRWKNKLKIWQ